jgi:hypothetical protein
MHIMEFSPCECGNRRQSSFTVTVFGIGWDNSNLLSAWVNCLLCGRKSHKRQGINHRAASDAAVQAWNNGDRYLPGEVK